MVGLKENISIPLGQSIICAPCRFKEVKFTEVSAPCLESFRTIDNTLDQLGGRVGENIYEQISVSEDCLGLTSLSYVYCFIYLHMFRFAVKPCVIILWASLQT